MIAVIAGSRSRGGRDEAARLLMMKAFATATASTSGMLEKPELPKRSTTVILPKPTWPIENLAVAKLVGYTLSPGEVKTLEAKMHTALAQTQYFRMLSRSDMRSILEAQAYQRADECEDAACLVELGKMLSVKKIVGGSIGRVGKTFSLTLRLIDVETGEAVAVADGSLTDKPDRLLGLVEEVANDLALKYARSKQQE